MKIIFIITSLSTGGAENMLYKLIQQISKNFSRIMIISLKKKGNFAQKIEDLGIEVVYLNFNFLFFFVEFNKLIKTIKGFNPDIVQTWMYHADLIGGIASKIAKVENIYWGVRQTDLSIKYNKLTTLIIRYMCSILSHKIPKLIVFCSSRSKTVHSLLGYNKKKLIIIPNGFNIQKFSYDKDYEDYLHTELNISKNKKLIGFIGRFHKQKNHKGFIQALNKVLNLTDDTEIILVGENIDHNNKFLMKLINHNIKNKIHLLGRRNDIPLIMNSLDLLVMFSWTEGFPNVLGEAMASELTCVASDVGDSAEIIGKTGCIVKPGDIDGLSDSIIKLIKKPLLRDLLGKKARRRITEQYEISIIARKYKQLYLNK